MQGDVALQIHGSKNMHIHPFRRSFYVDVGISSAAATVTTGSIQFIMLLLQLNLLLNVKILFILWVNCVDGKSSLETQLL